MENFILDMRVSSKLINFLAFHPNLHILVSDGCFYENGMFSASPAVDIKALEQIFRHKVLRVLLAKGKIIQGMISLLDKWRHTGFNVYYGPRVLPWQKKSMEGLPLYIILALSPRNLRFIILKPDRWNTNQRTVLKKRCLTHWSDWRPCAVTCSTRASRWPVIMDLPSLDTGDLGGERKTHYRKNRERHRDRVIGGRGRVFFTPGQGRARAVWLHGPCGLQAWGGSCHDRAVCGPDSTFGHGCGDA
jgi:hypothetical protein